MSAISRQCQSNVSHVRGGSSGLAPRPRSAKPFRHEVQLGRVPWSHYGRETCCEDSDTAWTTQLGGVQGHSNILGRMKNCRRKWHGTWHQRLTRMTEVDSEMKTCHDVYGIPAPLFTARARAASASPGAFNMPSSPCSWRRSARARSRC